MGRRAASFNRQKPEFRAQAKVLVLCEDSKSCLNYLEDAARHFRSYADIEIAHCDRTDPLGIVRVAIARKNQYDEIYCAIDRDSHQHFAEALGLADAHKEKLDVIVSYPCYEYWLLLHFISNRKPYVAAGGKSAGELLVIDLQKQPGMGKYAKGGGGNVFEQLIDRLPEAIKRADQVLDQALLENALNPSTRLHQLLRKFEELGRVAVLE